MSERGFTLIELLVVLVVMAILVAIAGPAFNDLIERQRLKGAVRTLLSDLRAARSEAIALGLSGSVTVTISSASSGAVWSYSIASTVTNTDATLPDGSAIPARPVITRAHTDYAGGITATVTGWTSSSCTAPCFKISPVRSLDASGIGAITFAVGGISAKVERNLLGGVFVCSDNGDLGYSACT